ncbi:MAG TPA: hypothetical protein PLW10_24620, partial [Myxococcota bacterium]|nr:hypothetical protein [Myxococcota bacterium]
MTSRPAESTPDRSRFRSQAVWVLGFFALLTLASALYGAGVKPLLKAGGIIALHSESAEARDWLQAGLGVASPDVIAVFTSEDLSALD